MNAAPLAIPDVLLFEPGVIPQLGSNGHSRARRFSPEKTGKESPSTGQSVLSDSAVKDAFMEGKLARGMRHRKAGMLFSYGHLLLRLEDVWGIRL
jgi:hypothetical protein